LLSEVGTFSALQEGGEEFGRGVDEEVGLEVCEGAWVGVAPADGGHGDAGLAGGFDVAGFIVDEHDFGGMEAELFQEGADFPCLAEEAGGTADEFERFHVVIGEEPADVGLGVGGENAETKAGGG